MSNCDQHKTFVWHLYNVGPTSDTLGRCIINVIQMLCVCLAVYFFNVTTPNNLQRVKYFKFAKYNYIFVFTLETKYINIFKADKTIAAQHVHSFNYIIRPIADGSATDVSHLVSVLAPK